MKFNTKLTATLLAALILTSATNAQAMGWSWKKWALFGAVATVATLVIKKMWRDSQEIADELSIELIHAAQNNNLEMVNSLIATGADVNPQFYSYIFALREAARNGQTDIVSNLVYAGSDSGTNQILRDRLNLAALESATLNNQTETALSLIADSTNINGPAIVYAACQAPIFSTTLK